MDTALSLSTVMIDYEEDRRWAIEQARIVGEGYPVNEPLRSYEPLEIMLRGYSVDEAVTLARIYVREAWEQGFERIVLVHGSPDSTHPRKRIQRGGKVLRHGGAIKWALRKMLRDDEFSPYARGPLVAWARAAPRSSRPCTPTELISQQESAVDSSAASGP